MAIVNKTALIGIVTVLYNADEVLPDFFASLAVQVGVKLKLYVIDNGTKDTGSVLSRELAAQCQIDVEIVFNNENVGVARGNNQGIEMALADGCDYVLLANNDTEFLDPLAIATLLRRTEAADALASVPKIIFHGTKRIWYAGGWFARLKATSPHVGYDEEDRGQFDKESFTEYAPTCFMLLHKSVFDRVGLMDEKYFVYYDDCDFVWRMGDAGIRLLYVTTSHITHKVAVSTGGTNSTFTLYYTTRNRVYFSRKLLPWVQSRIAITYSIVAMAVKCVKFSPAARSSVLKGFKDGFALPVVGNNAQARTHVAAEAAR